jgi:multicomponent Na+:H+ antiporter subunit E
MRLFIINILLMFVWVLITAHFDIINFIVGFAFSYIAIWVSLGQRGKSKYFKKLPAMIAFFFYFVWEFLIANFYVFYDIVTLKHHMNPAIVAVPLTVNTEMEITIFANLITLTPGTLSLDVSNDKKVIYVHTMYLKNKEQFISELKNGLEKKLLYLMR